MSSLLGEPAEVRRLPARPPRYAAWPDRLAAPLRAALAGSGSGRPWSHQAEAVEHALAGRHVVLATGTASGKTLGYLVPVLHDIVDGLGDPTGRGATALYLAPTKALAADQLTRVEALGLDGVRATTVDGDTGPEERQWARRHAHLVLTNPDLLHHSLLPGHEHWRTFLRRLRYVVVDECHTYRGVFGAHVAGVLRRLRRVAARYGAEPVFLLASATVAEPSAHAQRLTGLEVVAVTDDGSPRSARTVAFWSPDHPETRDTTEVAGLLLGDLVDRGVSTLAFARSRAGAERVAAVARRRLEAASPGAGRLVAAYRGGYLPEERRDLERRVRSGDLRGLAATTALELGVDLTGLDAVVMAGWPGRHAAFWQQAGRAGRAGREALVVLVPEADPVDRYVATHPDLVLGAPVEAGVLDVDNPHVLRTQLAAAVAELPLRDGEPGDFGPGAASVVAALTHSGEVRRRPAAWHWVGAARPTAAGGLRGASGVVSLVERSTGALVGTVDEAVAEAQVHAGAIHVHQGLAWVVTDLDLAGGVASVVRGDPGWRTQARRERAVRLLEVERHEAWAGGRVALGQVRVSSRVTGFERRGPAGELLGVHELDLPERSVVTRGVWWALETRADGDPTTRGALHAMEHALIAALPIVATCDRWDVSGTHALPHPDTGLPTVLVHDGVAGGAGLSARAYDRRAEWVAAAYQVVVGCPCVGGCPSCVQSVTCGSGNRPLDKAGARDLLLALSGRATGGRGEGGADPPGAAGDTARRAGLDTSSWMSEQAAPRR